MAIEGLRPDAVNSLYPTALPGTVIAESSRSKAAAGDDERIPRSFLALADIGALALALLVTNLLAPWVQWVLLNSGLLKLGLPEWMSLPPGVAGDQFPPLRSMAWAFMVTTPMTVFFMGVLGGYRQLIEQSRTRLLMTTVLSPAIALAFLTLGLFASKTIGWSRVFIFTFGLVSVLGLLMYRSMLRLYKKRRLEAGAYAKNVLVLGNASAVRWMIKHFREHISPSRYHLGGYMTVGLPDQFVDADLKPYGPAEDLGALLVNCPIHEVVAVQSPGEPDWLGSVIETCDYFRMKLHIVPAALLGGNLRDLNLAFRSWPLGLPELVLAPPNLDSEALFLKRLTDIVVSATLLILLAPMFVLIALGIKLTRPHLSVFYPWRVIGLKGRPFTGYKFTTMEADADRQRDALLCRNEMSGPVFKIKNDPRITPFGRFLRRYSLNELPQLWSVLKGDMSLVGPRPAFRHELERYELWHKRKLCVRPGITCLWQISGRNKISNFDDWVRLDLDYIDQWSFWLDCRILVRTLWAVVGGTGS